MESASFVNKMPIDVHVLLDYISSLFLAMIVGWLIGFFGRRWIRYQENFWTYQQQMQCLFLFFFLFLKSYVMDHDIRCRDDMGSQPPPHHAAIPLAL